MNFFGDNLFLSKFKIDRIYQKYLFKVVCKQNMLKIIFHVRFHILVILICIILQTIINDLVGTNIVFFKDLKPSPKLQF